MRTALDVILDYEKEINDLAATEPDKDERRCFRAAANALGRVRRSYMPPTPAGTAEDQGGEA
jgi:hypothetical protein